MSDLQILTGMSILISGYLQLKCGISCYHWQMIVGLAWFATITNFGCLSFLRRHLYNHQGERTLRLLGMGCIVTMLIVALVPTANYAWLHSSSGHSNASSYAICHFVYGPEEDSNSDIYSVLGRLNAALSIVLLAVASICRIILLHKYLSRRILGKWRTKASIYARSKLLALWIKWEIQSNTNVFQRHLLYHPLLACFLTIRILSDLIASMFFEVSSTSKCRMGNLSYALDMVACRKLHHRSSTSRQSVEILRQWTNEMVFRPGRTFDALDSTFVNSLRVAVFRR